MPVNRREYLNLVAGSVAPSLLASTRPSQAQTRPRIKAVVFDAFPIFDPRPVFALAEELFPGRGVELSNHWRTRQFEYTWLRSLSGKYTDFWKVTEEALVFAARMLKLALPPEKREPLMRAYLNLKSWPDAAPALAALKKMGFRLAFLSNFTPKMLDASIRSAGLEGLFEQALSTDRVKTYKPDPRAYQIGVDVLNLRREEILFAAFAGWDAAGARWFGYPTFWVNRMNLPAEELDVAPDASGQSLADLVSHLATTR